MDSKPVPASDDDWADIIERLRASAVSKDEPVLALSCALVVVQAQVKRLRDELS